MPLMIVPFLGMILHMTNAIDNVTDTKNASSFVDVSAAKVDFNRNAVSDIVGLIRAKYEDEGLRNFAIGKRFFEHAQWQKGNFAGTYQTGDFNNLAQQVRDEVRMFVPIKPESIRVADWARCHVLRELIATAISADRAATLSMFEYLAIVGKALHFTVADLEGSLNPGWLDMVKSVADERAAGTRVTRDDFENRIAATVKRANDAKAVALDPVAAAAKIASDKVKASRAAVKKTADAITSSVNDGLSNGSITPEGALAILEGVAKHHGKPLVAASVGFDPITATVAECETMIAAMFGAGRLVELKAIVAKASKAVAVMEKAAAKAASKATPEPVAAAA